LGEWQPWQTSFNLFVNVICSVIQSRKKRPITILGLVLVLLSVVLLRGQWLRQAVRWVRALDEEQVAWLAMLLKRSRVWGQAADSLHFREVEL
jgi:hypothetical protein